jgi:hypothetical protein
MRHTIKTFAGSIVPAFIKMPNGKEVLGQIIMKKDSESTLVATSDVYCTSNQAECMTCSAASQLARTHSWEIDNDMVFGNGIFLLL